MCFRRADLPGREEPEPAADDDDAAPQQQPQPSLRVGVGVRLNAVVGAAQAGGQPRRRLHGHRPRLRGVPRAAALPLPLRDDRHSQGHGLQCELGFGAGATKPIL